MYDIYAFEESKEKWYLVDIIYKIVNRESLQDWTFRVTYNNNLTKTPIISKTNYGWHITYPDFIFYSKWKFIVRE